MTDEFFLLWQGDQKMKANAQEAADVVKSTDGAHK